MQLEAKIETVYMCAYAYFFINLILMILKAWIPNGDAFARTHFLLSDCKYLQYKYGHAVHTRQYFFWPIVHNNTSQPHFPAEWTNYLNILHIVNEYKISSANNIWHKTRKNNSLSPINLPRIKFIGILLAMFQLVIFQRDNSLCSPLRKCLLTQ